MYRPYIQYIQFRQHIGYVIHTITTFYYDYYSSSWYAITKRSITLIAVTSTLLKRSIISRVWLVDDCVVAGCDVFRGFDPVADHVLGRWSQGRPGEVASHSHHNLYTSSAISYILYSRLYCNILYRTGGVLRLCCKRSLG